MLGPILETLIGGLLTGVLYSLVALGFVLIFKASGVFNFAQGAMVLFAALSLARLSEFMPLPLALVLSVAIMIALAYAIEFLVLRHLVNQEGIILFMATLGIAYFLDGFGADHLGQRHLQDPARPAEEPDLHFRIGVPRRPADRSVRADRGDHLRRHGGGAGGVLPGHPGRPRLAGGRRRSSGGAIGRHPAQSDLADGVGGAGLVALVAGMMWGAKLGVQFSLSLVALKALPVLILGGFTSIPGAIVGGLIIGAGEKLAEVVLGPVLIRTFDLAGGGIENWFAYVLALVFLLFRPQGLFGERIIERV